MAGLKKPGKKKDTTKPGTVLIMFLVFFILLSIGLGVWGYYGYDGQTKLRDDAKAAKGATAAAKNAENYRIGQIGLLLSSLGNEIHPDLAVLYKAELDEIAKDGSKYKEEKDQPAFAKLFAELKTDLTYDDASKAFKDNYKARIDTIRKELKNSQAQLGAAQKELKATQDQFTAYQNKLEAYWKTALNQIGKGNAETKAAAEKRYEAITALLDANQKIQTEKLDIENKLKEAQEKLGIEIARFNKLQEEKKNNNLEVVSVKKENSDRHALVLDMSRGMPLWDRPLGKITRVNLEKREVYINIGKEKGSRPELTFNIFADDGKGNATKYLKGTLEIVRVIDATSSLARVTSLYDASGVEIALSDMTKGRIDREVENAIREGDLLFNLFWNTHVAIAGSINFTGIPIDAPSEQMRQLSSIAQLLERMDIHVDAVLDLADAQVKGAITNKTRFLVLGERAHAKNPNDEGQKDRAKLINDAIGAMKQEAVDRGLYLISAENFMLAAGYRFPRNSNNVEVGNFRATPPLAGNAAGGLVIQRDRPVVGRPPAPMPEMKEEKKEEKKEEEKKDAEK